MEHARPARPDDLPQCRQLVAAAVAAAGAQRGGARLLAGSPGPPTGAEGDDRAAGDAEPSSLLATWASGAANRILLVGTFCDAVVGIAAGHVSGEEASGDGPARTIGVVDCCYVDPAARQVGVGTALMVGLVEWFGLRRCTDIDALALPGDRSTKQLLESAGFSARLLVLHRRLP